MSIQIASRKTKGRNLQKWVCKKIAEITRLKWGYEDHSSIKPRPMGQKGLDVILDEKALKLFPFSIECKSAESWNIMSAMKQVQDNKRPNTHWLVVLKKKKLKKPIVVMDSDTFFEMARGFKKGDKNS